MLNPVKDYASYPIEHIYKKDKRKSLLCHNIRVYQSTVDIKLVCAFQDTGNEMILHLESIFDYYSAGGSLS